MGAQSVSKIGVLEEDQANYLNSETYLHYYNRLMLLLTSMFKWENLPNNIPERFIEKTLFNFGVVAFVNDRNFGYIASQCTMSSELNIYNEPTAWECYSNNGYRNRYWSEEVEIIRNNKFSVPTMELIKHHLSRLFDLERTIDTNLYQQRNLAVIKSNEVKLLTNKNFMKKFDEHGYFIFGDDNFNSKSFDVINFNVPFIADKLEDIKDRKFNDLLNMFGINTANTQKKERLITDEANANNQMIEINLNTMLRERELAVERINARYPELNITVEISKELQESLGMNEGDSVE